jgi:hypothetical protein
MAERQIRRLHVGARVVLAIAGLAVGAFVLAKVFGLIGYRGEFTREFETIDLPSGLTLVLNRPGRKLASPFQPISL